MDPGASVGADLDYLLDAARTGASASDNRLFAPPAGLPPAAAGPAAGGPAEPATEVEPVPEEGAASAGNSRKRPLDDKKARDKKRILRNRELARVSNERRKGRIKAMETELEDTRKTVSNLEESIRTLEAENTDLKGLLENRNAPRL